MKPILIVDDEEVMRDSLKEWLTDGGYEVETAEAGEEALKELEIKDYEIAILELRLPGKDGIEVVKEARAKKPQLKGIIMTAYPTVESYIEAMREGVHYLQKPFDLNELEGLIQNIYVPGPVTNKELEAVAGAPGKTMR